MPNDSSLVANSAQFPFDLESQEGVMFLLSSVRASEISSEEKNELRDLIFLYTNGGRDQSVRITLEQKVLKYNVVPFVVKAEKVETKETASVDYSFGTSRLSPDISASVSVTPPAPTSTPQPEPVQPVAEPVPQPVAEPAPVSVTPPAPTSTPQPEPVQPVAEPAPELTPEPAPVSVTPPAPTPTPQPEPVQPVAEPVPELTPEPAPVSVTPPAPTPTPQPEPVQPVAEPVPQPVAEPAPVSVTPPAPTPTPQPEPVQPVAEPVPELTPESAPVSVTPPAPTSTPQSTSVLAQAGVPPIQMEALQRIREIKALVNERVGNPVNLVNINNAVGREYMSALLEAMKKVNNGSSTTSAMARLEAAYVSVEKTLEAHDSGALEEEKQSSEPITSTPEPTPEPEISSEPEPEHIPTTVSQSINETVSESELDTPTEPVQEEVKGVEPISAWGPATDTVIRKKEDKTKPEPSAEEVKPSGKFSSLAQAKEKPQTLDNLADPKSLETSSVAGDPLYTKEVDEGLQQLLSEWVIFKKSGFFGTGPKGREHPLYKKISELQIPLLLAGRFEGATQTIKQSITDYMNGWRYEQGIVYQQGENFDHYLRRVIRHILDLQNTKRPS